MALAEIIRKSTVVDTPRASDLATRPAEWTDIFQFHVSTHVAIADMTDKWDAILKNLLRGRSATGLIHADTGYGKTSTAAALWHYAEQREIVAVPPFVWNSIADMLIATHGWVCHRLKAKRPDLILGLVEQYERLIASSDEDRAVKISQEQDVPLDYARKSVQSLKAQGDLMDAVSANRLIDYLRMATSTLLEAEYKGLLILPDEFELFADTNPDIAKNFAELKDFIFPIFQEDSLPIGCVVLTYSRTFSDIQLRAPYIFARFDKPEGSLIDLEQAYGKIEENRSFAHELWEKLSVGCNLTDEEQKAIDPDVLFALGQFLGHPRTPQLISGPRSVVATFRRAAKHYGEKKQPYSIFDFCEDYISQGLICFNNQEIDAVKAHTSIMSQPIIGADEARQRVVKLLCVCPDGVPEEFFRKHGISDEDRLAVVQGLLGTHVITKIIGPALTGYKDDLQAGDALIEILKILRSQYNPASEETHRAAVRSFANYILPEVLQQRTGAAHTGWRDLEKTEGDIEPIFQARLTGTSLRDYPQRTLTVHVGTEKFQKISPAYRESQLFTSFIFRTQGESSSHSPNTCDIRADGLYFSLNISKAIGNREIPKDIGKLGDLFLPESVTPSLLLSMLDFFDQETTIAKIKELKQETHVKLLKSRIRDQLIGYFFSAEVKTSAESQQADLAQVPAGKNFVERALGVLIKKKFKSYRSVAVSHQWQKNLGIYMQALSRNAESLGMRRGEEPTREMTASEVPRLFNVGQHTTFAHTLYPNGVLRDLLLVNETDANGKTIAEGVEVKNNQSPVVVYFKLHDVEKRVLEMLEASTESIDVDGNSVNAVKYHEVFQQEESLGYLNTEIEELIKLLTTRGLVDKRQYRGMDYLYRVETEINLAELQRRFNRLKDLEALAKSKDFDFTLKIDGDHSFESVQADFRINDIGANEVRKDSLRQKLNSIENAFKTQCTEWLMKAQEELSRKAREIEILRLDPPNVLKQETGHPATEFSVLLFQDIRNEIRKAYSAIPQEIDKVKKQAQAILNKKIQEYLSNQIPEKAITVAADFRGSMQTIDKEIEALREERSEAELLYELFEKWRNLARDVERNRLTMTDAQEIDGVKSLCDRLDEEQKRIKRYLADRTKTVKQVLENYEYFFNQIAAIKGEFDQVSERRKDEFIRFQADIEDQLRQLIDKPDIGEQFNPNDVEGSYSRVREKAVGKIQEFVIKSAIQRITELKSELMKPLEVFTVSDQIKNQAKEMSDALYALEERINEMNVGLKPDDVNDLLSAWVESLKSIREAGNEVFTKWEGIQDQLRCDKSELGPKEVVLLDMIEANADKDFTELIIDLRQSKNKVFGSTSEIIESLEELYQRNWLNIKISRTIG